MKTRTIQEKAVRAMKEAIRNVVKEHKKAGRPLAVWKDGKVAYISPDNVPSGKR